MERRIHYLNGGLPAGEPHPAILCGDREPYWTPERIRVTCPDCAQRLAFQGRFPPSAAFGLRRREVDAWLVDQGAVVIRVPDLGAALEARHYGGLAVHLATGALAYPPPHPGPPLCATHAAHFARLALGLTVNS